MNGVLCYDNVNGERVEVALSDEMVQKVLVNIKGEYAVGEVFDYEGERYEVVEDTSNEECGLCAFDCSGLCNGQLCSKVERSDGKGVHFVKVPTIKMDICKTTVSAKQKPLRST